MLAFSWLVMTDNASFYEVVMLDSVSDLSHSACLVSQRIDAFTSCLASKPRYNQEAVFEFDVFSFLLFISVAQLIDTLASLHVQLNQLEVKHPHEMKSIFRKTSVNYSSPSATGSSLPFLAKAHSSQQVRRHHYNYMVFIAPHGPTRISQDARWTRSALPASFMPEVKYSTKIMENNRAVMCLKSAPGPRNDNR